MQDLFELHETAANVSAMPVLSLAHLGDCVYELMVRSMLILKNGSGYHGLHSATVRYVCAPAQAEAVEKILPMLTEEEASYYRRGRNANVHTIPKNATHAQYSRATGLETLFGALYLLGRKERIKELFAVIMEDSHAT